MGASAEVTALNEVATDRQNLIFAQTVQLQDEKILKNAISKRPWREPDSTLKYTIDQPKQPAAMKRPPSKNP